MNEYLKMMREDSIRNEEMIESLDEDKQKRIEMQKRIMKDVTKKRKDCYGEK